VQGKETKESEYICRRVRGGFASIDEAESPRGYSGDSATIIRGIVAGRVFPGLHLGSFVVAEVTQLLQGVQVTHAAILTDDGGAFGPAAALALTFTSHCVMIGYLAEKILCVFEGC
jgi:hypothetical protein